jgi:hypothetical protein
VPFVLHLLCMAIGGVLEIDAHNLIRPQSRWYCGCLSNAVLGLAATVYLLVGLTVTTVAVMLLSTYSTLLPHLYTLTLLGSGIATLLVAAIGFLAACERRNEQGVRARRCQFYLLELFALLTLGLLVASIAGLLLLLAWDNMLSGLASATELEFEGSALDFNEDLRTRSSEATTDFIQTLSTNAFRACGGTVVVAGAAANASYVLGDELGSGSPALEGSSFTLRCNNDASNMCACRRRTVCLRFSVACSVHRACLPRDARPSAPAVRATRARVLAGWVASGTRASWERPSTQQWAPATTTATMARGSPRGPRYIRSRPTASLTASTRRRVRAPPRPPWACSRVPPWSHPTFVYT